MRMARKLAGKSGKLGANALKRLAEKPTLRLGLGLYWRAYSELKRDRPMGMDLGPIPWTSIDRWCAAHGLIGEARADLFHLVCAMDDGYLEWRANKQKAQNAARTQPERPPPPPRTPKLGNQPPERSRLPAPSRRSGGARRGRRG